MAHRPGDGLEEKTQMESMTAEDLRTARAIAEAADDGGTIPPLEMVRLFPGRPTLHTWTTIASAWRAAFPGVDTDDLSEHLFG
jgi:hypothetical protein